MVIATFIAALGIARLIVVRRDHARDRAIAEARLDKVIRGGSFASC